MDKIKLTLKLDRTLIPEGEEAQRYLQALITSPRLKSSERPARLPLNLALVIDRSGSMSGEKLERAKEAAISCLRRLNEDDRVAVVAYDDVVRIVSESERLTSMSRSRMIEQIQGIRVGGSTNLAGGWLTGAQEVAAHLSERFINRVILLSDGLANVGITDLEELARHASELRARGVSTTTMGIGEGFNEDLMEVMAVKGGGHFYFIEHARQIPDIMAREVGEVLSTVAREARFELVVPLGMKVTLLNNFESKQRDERTIVVSLGDLTAEEERSLVFKLTTKGGVPAGNGVSAPVFEGSLVWQDAATRERQSTVESVSARVADPQACQAEQPDLRVSEEAALLEVAIAKEEALRYDAAGNYAMSSTVLQNAADYLATVAPASPAAAAEAESLRNYSSAAPSGLGALARKALHYEKSTRQQSRKK